MCLLALCCALAAQPLRLMAATPTPYGEQFVRLGESWPDAGVVKPWPEADPAADAAPGSASFERQLELLEGEGGRTRIPWRSRWRISPASIAAMATSCRRSRLTSAPCMS